MKINCLLPMLPAIGLTTGSLAFAAPHSATFDVRHELNVTVPEGAKRVRIWFALDAQIDV